MLHRVEESGSRIGEYARLVEAVRGRPLPLALVDLDAVDANVDLLASVARDKAVRVASKSLRSPALLRHVVDRGGARFGTLMTYAARETPGLVAAGFKDLLLAYPTTQPKDLELVAKANADGTVVSVVADAPEHLDALDAAGSAVGTKIPVVVDVDVSYRALGGVHLGVLRSPLRSPEDVRDFALSITRRAHLTFHGVMAYEAQVAGIADHDPFSPRLDSVKRAIKSLSRADVAKSRAEIVKALTEAGIAPPLFNGGGTGSVRSSIVDPSLSEVTIGSGFLASHLFDHYKDLALRPAVYFALEVVRAPRRDVVTCHGGGYVASGEAGPSRLPVPAWPAGLSLVALEGAGEVQTPLRVPKDVTLRIGDPVFFRHAKAGELAEHFGEYLLMRGAKVVGEASTYRGLAGASRAGGA
jgi:D-serine deaminase-like pyridoxal phosphate-dependent protein